MSYIPVAAEAADDFEKDIPSEINEQEFKRTYVKVK